MNDCAFVERSRQLEYPEQIGSQTSGLVLLLEKARPKYPPWAVKHHAQGVNFFAQVLKLNKTFLIQFRAQVAIHDRTMAGLGVFLIDWSVQRELKRTSSPGNRVQAETKIDWTPGVFLFTTQSGEMKLVSFVQHCSVSLCFSQGFN